MATVATTVPIGNSSIDLQVLDVDLAIWIIWMIHEISLTLYLWGSLIGLISIVGGFGDH